VTNYLESQEGTLLEKQKKKKGRENTIEEHILFIWPIINAIKSFHKSFLITFINNTAYFRYLTLVIA